MSKKIIACIDGSQASTAVCDAAVWASQYLDNPLTLLHVLDREGYVTESNLSGAIGLGSRETLLGELAELDAKRSKLALEQGKLMLEAAKAHVVDQTSASVDCRQRHGSLVDTLSELDSEMALLVIGREGADAETHPDSHIGSHLESVIRTQHHPILVALETFTTPTSVVIAYDGSDTAKKALDMLCTTTLLQSLECHLVMVGESETDRAALNDEASRLSKHGVATHAVLLNGDIEQCLNDYINHHDIGLLVMGAYGHSRIRQFFVGSTTTKLIGSSSVPLLLLR